jgi:hypothetical protein
MLIHCVFVEILLAQSSSKWLILFEKHATANSSANGNKYYYCVLEVVLVKSTEEMTGMSNNCNAAN